MAEITQATPAEVRDGLARGDMLLVDVREANEYAFERIPGALLYPLSSFEPKALPAQSGRTLVLHCGSGGRSMRAAQQLVGAGHTAVANLDGGIKAWKAASLPLIRVDPATGRLIEHGQI